MSAIEVLKERANTIKAVIEGIPSVFDKEELKEEKEYLDALDEAVLALEKQKNGLKCIGCGSIPKLKLCCNSCYQRLKLKEKRQVELIEWLEKKIDANKKRLDWQYKHREQPYSFQIAEGIEQRIADLKEILERVGEQK